MSTQTYPLIGGRRMRLTRLDACGAPAYGNFAQAVSSGFVSVAVTANYDDGTEVVLKNAGGERCVQRDAEPELINLSIAYTFCQVNPDIYSAFTGYPKVLDPATGDVIGYIVDRAVKPMSVKNALEVWSDAQGNQGCGDDEEIPYGYFLWPFLAGARIGDYTLEDGSAVTFSVTTVLTKDGSQWDVGPHLVLPDDEGDPTTLYDPITSTQHQFTARTVIAPPAITDGLVPLDDPDGVAATTATAGIPGTWNGTRPANITALQASAITGSGGASPWAVGQHVILGDGTHAYWAGSGETPKWEPGDAPA